MCCSLCGFGAVDILGACVYLLKGDDRVARRDVSAELSVGDLCRHTAFGGFQDGQAFVDVFLNSFVSGREYAFEETDNLVQTRQGDMDVRIGFFSCRLTGLD